MIPRSISSIGRPLRHPPEHVCDQLDVKRRWDVYAVEGMRGRALQDPGLPLTCIPRPLPLSNNRIPPSLPHTFLFSHSSLILANNCFYHEFVQGEYFLMNLRLYFKFGM